ncbi:hypothetical protein LIN78_02110 [Leeia sp. TBRC 13508]|uniref:Uncharacterized protein n=1 Tax=Leeia speluncae TaxID=2884804 RepID=A0ABS8D2C6_9NEIS|nr:hypothetical protein [Leeia speluncae]MCB6182349.1 hypothetical protein [Leeia speluncae]
MRIRRQIPTSLDDAIEKATQQADRSRRPAKVMADLMGVELKTYYRWLSESSMPLNRLRQFETFCGAHFVSDYLSTAAGRVVIEIPVGKKAKPEDIANMQAMFGKAIMLLSQFWETRDGMEETLSVLTETLQQVAFQRENVLKSVSPELDLFGDFQ